LLLQECASEETQILGFEGRSWLNREQAANRFSLAVELT
jgi:hypothetical protein